MKQKRFNRTPLATSLSLILGAATALPLAAQESGEQPQSNDVEVIQVKGIRGSLIRAMDVKRDSTGVVDAISAEDMGKFPDTNLAESLQRISGVSIDRQNGEGSRVTVRGFGPDYNLVTLNGRQMPTANIEATSASDSRSFDFGNLASEGVSAVEVFKTSRASIPTGGIGSVINLITTKPLASPGLKATFGVKGVHDTSSDEGDTITPELSGLYSNTFADDTIGIAISGSYQNRQSGAARAGVDNGWRDQVGGEGNWGALPDAPAGLPDPHVNRPADGVVYAVPQNLVYGFSETDRTRTNGQLTLQYQPSERLTATLDYTYSKNDVETNQNIHSVWMNFGHIASEWTDANADGVAAPLYIEENNTNVAGEFPPYGHQPGDLTHADLVSQVEQSGQVNENKSIGINLEFDVNDNLRLELDYHDSSAEAKPNSKYGNSNTIQMATNIRGRTAIDFRSDFPVVTVTFPGQLNAGDFATAEYPNPNNSLSDVNGLVPDTVRTTGTSLRNSYMRSDVEQLQVKGRYSFDSGVLSSIDFGVARTEVDNRNAFAVAERATWGGVGDFDDIPNDVLLDSFSTMLDRFDNMPGDKANMINGFWDVDFETFAEIVATNYGVPLNADGSPADAAWPCGLELCAPSEYTTDRRTLEEQTSAFVQANFEFDVADMPVTLRTGLRYEETDVTSNTLLPDVTSIAWISDNEFRITRGAPLFYEGDGSYDHVLPSIDFDIEITDDIIFRASYSESITRPAYGYLTAGGRLDEVRIDEARGSRGNPGLLPIESENFDLSLEWYYDEGSYASIGYFRKDVKNFISSESIIDSPFSVTNPTTGPRFDAAVAAIGGDITNSPAIREEIVSQNPNDPNVIPPNPDTGEGAQIIGGPDDNPVVVNFSQPVNSDEKQADGIEFAIQHLFWDSGFGLYANVTLIDSDLEYDNGDTTNSNQTPLIGLSDSANVVVFYDKEEWQVRLAYNWRDSFFESELDAIGFSPVYVEEYGQLDINVSYQVSENLSVSVEGINLTDEISRKYGRHERMTRNIEQTGPRYQIGVRYTF
ncbi:TonB-dependent receptor [Aestuariibacter sp. AA17]|uniref:TonB-dependent receptor n=1 Tax=Fluctibacter corallii TaxID=2984329 RepID=A0ABT3A753_9ALTE|nr:TonB-dependent receptor [Aestuariibacter sp. AA17]MCV2884515.1 TonB-dependent receptor [Aestuariibacter sp. AA17]